MKVLKFGGTSLQDAERMSRAAQVVVDAAASGPVTVVVSALGGVTDDLLRSAAAYAGGRRADADIRRLEGRHLEVAARLAAPAEIASLKTGVREEMATLGRILEGVALVRECSARTRDEVLAHGERLAALLMAAALRQRGIEAEAADARRLLVTDDRFGAACVDESATRTRLRTHFAEHPALQVVTGFTGATPEGITTTLGRGGSDLTASILGAALGATRIEIWTDVDGVMSADPRLVADAFSLESLSYEELMEMSHFGAKVVFPPTVHPARALGISLVIRNTDNPGFAGTEVVGRRVRRGQPVCGISSVHEVSLLQLEGDGMVGVPGIAARLFGSLARAQVSVILISQASSEHSICFAVLPDDVGVARAAIAAEFALEHQAGLVNEIGVEEGLAVVAVVGEEMRRSPGVAGRVFSVLGAEGVNVRAIAQGSSERNISFVVASTDERQALNAIHRAFFGRQPVTAREPARLFIVGVGQVGGALVEHLRRRPAAHDLRVVALAGSRRVVTDPSGIGLEDWQRRLEAVPARLAPGPLRTVLAALERASGRRVLVDCTASSEVAAATERVLQAGASVVAANKLFFAGPHARWTAARELARRQRVHLLHEATVGAGLPVVGTVETLLATGDEIQAVEGVFSGSLGFMLARLREGTSFSDSLREAARHGYLEPDPRVDLSGWDAARKLLILARLAGSRLDLEDVAVESLVPAGLEDLSTEAFRARLGELDPVLEGRLRRAAAAGKTLCYLARFARGRAEVGLREVDTGHPCATLAGTDNLFALTTRRYASPLVIRGPGAGPEVTAAGVLGDILRAASS